MQFTFRQQSGPTTTTNIEHQPSFDKTKQTEITVSQFIVLNEPFLMQTKSEFISIKKFA